MADHFINVADEAGKTAQKIGLTTEAFTSLGYASELAADSTEPLQTGFKQFSKLLTEFHQNGQAALDTFAEVGVSVTDAAGNMLSSEAAFKAVSDRFASMPDGAEKTAAALKLFGKSGSDLIPLLNEGADGLRELQAEADAFGQTIATSTSKEANEFNDNLRRMKLMLQGVVNVAVAEVLPMLSEWSSWMVKTVQQSGLFQGAVGTLVDLFKVVAFSIELAVYKLKAFYDALKLFGDFLVNSISTWIDAQKIFFDAFAGGVEAVEELMSGHFSNAKVLFKETLDGLKFDWQQFRQGFGAVGGGLKSDWQNLWSDLSKTPKLPELFQGPSIKPGAIQPYGPMPALPNQTVQPHFVGNDDVIANMERLKKLEDDMDKGFSSARVDTLEAQGHSLDSLVLKTQALKDVEDIRFQNRIDQIAKQTTEEEEGFRLVEKAWQEHGQRLMQIQAQQSKATSMVFANNADAMATAFGNFAQAAAAFGKKNSALFKALMIMQAIASTAAGVARALADYPWPYSLVVAAAVGAAGAAQIATVSALNPEGAAHGGLGYVPSEATYLLDRGERVLSPKQNSDLTDFLGGQGGGNSGMIENNIYLDGVKIAQTISDWSRSGQLEIHSRAIIA